ncbi:MAG: hypothetical protein NVS9B3_11280 [Gemmatimonadaceae bacterium]
MTPAAAQRGPDPGRDRSHRRAFTLAEIVVAMVLLGVVGGVVVAVLGQQQRFYRTTAALVENRTQLREAGQILATDLRGTSSAGGDIRAMTAHALDVVANMGSAVVCDIATTTRDVVDVPPLTLATGNTLTAWLVRPKEGDLAFVYDAGRGRETGRDQWQVVSLDSIRAGTGASWCPAASRFTSDADRTVPRYRLFLHAPLSSTTTAGAPIRFGRAIRYRFYQVRGGWYLGFDDCQGGRFTACSGIQPVAGPYAAGGGGGGGGGLGFHYYDDLGAPTGDPRKVARIDVLLRTETRSVQERFGIGGEARVRDSLTVTIAVRNRL